MRWPVAGLLVAVAGCGASACGSAEEEAQPVAPPSVLTAVATGTATAPVDVAEPPLRSEPPADTGLPVLTMVGTGVPLGEPPPRPAVDAADCAARWNGAANAELRATLAGPKGPRPAFAIAAEPADSPCTVLLTSHGDGLTIFYEVRDGVFAPPQDGVTSATGFTRPPDWYLQPDGTLEGPLDPPPPRATMSTPSGVVTAGTGSYCWDVAPGQTQCGDSVAPSCDDGFTPRLLVDRDAAVTIQLPFEPLVAPTLTVTGEGGRPLGEPHTLPKGATATWDAALEPGLHAVMLFVRPIGGGDVSYTACLDVAERVGSGRGVAEPPDAAATFGAGDTRADVDVQRDGGAFGLAGSGNGPDRPPEWWLPTGGRLERPLAEPPAASVSGAYGTIGAGFGSYCWSGAGCVDEEWPSCGDGWTPSMPVPPGKEVAFALPFVPTEAPVLTVHDGSGSGEQVRLEAADPVWRVDLPRGRHAVSLFVRGPEGGDVAYTACLDVLA